LTRKQRISLSLNYPSSICEKAKTLNRSLLLAIVKEVLLFLVANSSITNNHRSLFLQYWEEEIKKNTALNKSDMKKHGI